MNEASVLAATTITQSECWYRKHLGGTPQSRAQSLLQESLARGVASASFGHLCSISRQLHENWAFNYLVPGPCSMDRDDPREALVTGRALTQHDSVFFFGTGRWRKISPPKERCAHVLS